MRYQQNTVFPFHPISLLVGQVVSYKVKYVRCSNEDTINPEGGKKGRRKHMHRMILQ